MKFIETANIDMWVSSDLFQDATKAVDGSFIKSPEYFVEDHFDSLLGSLSELERDYIDLYARTIQSQTVKSFAMLWAHGDQDKHGRWRYMDGSRSRLLQSWLKNVDGKYAVLVLGSCNVASLTPVVSQSLTLLADTSYSLQKVESGDVHLSLLHPRAGDLDYTIEYQLEQLRAQCA